MTPHRGQNWQITSAQGNRAVADMTIVKYRPLATTAYTPTFRPMLPAAGVTRQEATADDPGPRSLRMPRSPDRRHRAGDGETEPRPARRRLPAAVAGQAAAGARAVPGHRHVPRRRRGTASAHLLGDANPVTGPVRHTSQADQAWADLASQLTPPQSAKAAAHTHAGPANRRA